MQEHIAQAVCPVAGEAAPLQHPKAGCAADSRHLCCAIFDKVTRRRRQQPLQTFPCMAEQRGSRHAMAYTGARHCLCDGGGQCDRWCSGGWTCGMQSGHVQTPAKEYGVMKDIGPHVSFSFWQRWEEPPCRRNVQKTYMCMFFMHAKKHTHVCFSGPLGLEAWCYLQGHGVLWIAG